MMKISPKRKTGLLLAFGFFAFATAGVAGLFAPIIGTLLTHPKEALELESNNNGSGDDKVLSSAGSNNFNCEPVISYAISDCQSSHADINLTVSGFYPPFSYKWSDIVAEAIWSGNNTTNDASGNSHNLGTGSVGTIAYDASDKVEGSHAFSFNGSTFLRYGVDGGFLETSYSARTYSLWIKPTNLTGTKILFEQGGSSAGVACRLSGNQLTAAYRASSTQYTTGVLTFPNDGAWHHVAVVFNSGTLTCYLDGTASTNATSSNTTIAANSNNDALGGRNGTDAFASGSANYFSGRMDDVQLFYSALSAQKIADIARNDGDRLNLTAGTYTVTVSNSMGCTSTMSIAFTIPCTEVCNNGADDDGDGAVDGADLDCGTFCPTGGLTYERWLNISGAAVSNLTSAASYPNSPSQTGTLTSFDSPDNIAENYGTRVRGFIRPSQTGTYTFNLTGDDGCELYLSTDADPADKVLISSVSGYTGITEYTKYAAQTSSSITLVAGQNYYVELLHKEAGGDDHFQVYWKTPSSSSWTIVPGANLRPYVCVEICNNAVDDDGDGLTDNADTDCDAFCTTGTLNLERWLGIGGGTAILDLTSNANYPNSPSETGMLTSFNGPDNYADAYGTRVRGYITPSQTGIYTFNLTGDDNCELYLSSDATAANKLLIASIPEWTDIAEYTKFSSQTSLSIFLTAGRNYYVELLHKEGGGGDHFQVYWKTPSNSTWTIVPGTNIRPLYCSEICGNGVDDDGDGLTDCADSECSPTVTVTPNPASICQGASISLTAIGSGDGACDDYVETLTQYLGDVSNTSACLNVPDGVGTYMYSVNGNYTRLVFDMGEVKPAGTDICVKVKSATQGVTATFSAWILANGAPATGNYTLLGAKSTTSNVYADFCFTLPSANRYFKISQTSDGPLYVDAVASDCDDNGLFTYAWSNGGFTPTITVSPTTTTNYTVTVTNSLGCTATLTRTVTVNALPNAAISGTNSICPGASTTLTASGGGTYAWSTGATTAAVTVSPISTTTYTVTVTSANGCTATAARIVTVNALPTAAVTGTNTICAGASTTLTASGGGTYLWSTGATTAAITINPAATTTYTATVTNANGCTATATRTVTVNGLPTASISGTNSVCTGGSTTLTASGGGTYAWSTGATTAAITVTPASSTTYIVTVTNSNGCTATASNTVTVNGPPTAAATGTNTICNGASTTITASGGGTYLWSTGATTAAITVSPTSTTTYTVTVTSASGCTATANRIVTVNALPTAAVTGTNTICAGGSTTLTASGGGTYLWSTGATTAAITINPAATTTYTVTVTNASGCTATATRTVTVNGLPTASISGTNSICTGGSTTLTASGGGTYVWSTGATTAAITVTPASTTTYTVTVTNSNGCTATASNTVTVNGPPTAAVTGTNTICNGASTTITASGGGTYLWSTGATTAAVTVSPTSTTTYTVTVTSASGCTATANRIVTVNALPTAAVTGTNTICAGASTTLTASGGGTYLWSTGATTVAISVTPSSTTTYTVTVTNANGCTATANRDVTVNAPPTVAITGASTLCNGASTTLTASGGGTYVWSTGATTAAITVTPASTTTYTVTVTASNGCTSTASNIVTVNSLPSTSISGTNMICVGASTTLTASGGGTYAWSTGATTADISVTPATTTTYTVTVTITGGCTTTASRTVTVNALPTAVVTGTNTICTGASTTLTASGGGTYLWSTGATTAAISVTPSSTTTYTVTVTNASGCTATANRIVTVNALPTAAVTGTNTICAGASTTLTASGGGTYLWSTGATTAGISVTPTSTTTYTVTVTNASGCTATANRVVTVNALPTAAVTGTNTICAGASTTITASGGGTYLWNTGATTAGISVTPSSTTTYTVTVTNANGCTATGSRTVTVNSLPTVSISGTNSICPGVSTTLTASGGGAYTWNTGATTAAITVTPLSTTTYTVTVTAENGCTATQTRTVTVNNCTEVCNNGIDDDGDGLTDCADSNCGPTTFAGTDVSICIGGNVTLSASATGGALPYIFAWSHGLGTGQSKAVNPIATTTYGVTVTSASGCTSTDQVTVTVTPCSEVCADGLDNDGDGLVDCEDPDCAAVGQPNLANDIYETCPGVIFVEQPIFNDLNIQNPIYSIFANASKGQVSINHQGVFTYNPYESTCGKDSFQYQVCNSASGCCDQAMVVLNIGDHDAPQLKNVPADITLSCNDPVPGAPLVLAIDDCPGIFINLEEVSNQINASTCQNYSIVRTWTATDNCGNAASASQTINVVDNLAPEIFRVYTLANGKKLVAGVVQNGNTSWKHVKFPISFDNVPLVFSQVTSVNGSEAVITRHRYIDQEGFELKIQEEEAGNGVHANEQVAWLAMEPGALSGTSNLQAGLLNNVTHANKLLNYTTAYASAPVMVAAVQTNTEADPMQVRFTTATATSAQLFLEEEKSLDNEVAHGNETVAYLAANAGEIVDEHGELVAIAGTSSFNEVWKTINFGKKMFKPVVIFGGQPTGNDPATVRVRNVTSTSFEAQIDEWDYLNGATTARTLSYFVVEGSIPAFVDDPCEITRPELLPGLNLFAVDNCDNQVAMDISEASLLTPNGLIKTKIWACVDDCGNTATLVRSDTCNLAAVRIRSSLGGSMIGYNPSSSLMRDNLRSKSYIPSFNPYGIPEGLNPNAEGQNSNQYILPSLLGQNGDNAIVDWMLVEVRDTSLPETVLVSFPCLIQRDGDMVMANTGSDILAVDGLPEGPYFVRIKHRNHLGVMTAQPVYLKLDDVPLIDFSLPSVQVFTGAGGRKLDNGKMTMWPGDFNNDNRIIYQGPSNDVFYLFSDILAHPLNVSNLANFIKLGYEDTDINMDGNAIFQGPSNDRAMLLLNTILAHPSNTFLLANFVAAEILP